MGFVKTSDQRLEKDPDLRVQHVIERVFEKFFELGSARQAAMWFIDHGVEFPAKRQGPAGWETRWRRPAYRNVIAVLREPAYAGAYACGRTAARTQVVNGQLEKRIAHKPLEEWAVLIPEHHEGYISWESFMKVQQMLKENGADFRVDESRGAPKKGPALLAGMLRCRRCGRKLMVGYSGKNATVPRYECHRGRLDNMEKKCISFGGLLVDAAVSREILRVIRPCAVQAAALAVREENHHNEQLVETLKLELKSARYTAGLARRQYDAVDPDNRLVASELERRWNDALGRVQELEDRLEQEQSRAPVPTPEPALLGDLHAELDQAWHSPHADQRLRKRILRTLIEEVVVDLAEREVVLVIHWKGGLHSELRVPRRRRGQSGAHTSTEVVDAVSQLARICKDKAIAGYLNRNAIFTARGNRWGAMAVASLRNKRGIEVHTSERQQAGGWMNLTQAAAHLGVAAKTVRRAAEGGLIQADHPLHDGPWVFNRFDIEDPAVRQRVTQQRRTSEAAPTGPAQKQLELAISTTYGGEGL